MINPKSFVCSLSSVCPSIVTLGVLLCFYWYSGPYGAQRVVWVAQSSMGNEQVNSPTESAKSRFWYKPMVLQWILCIQNPMAKEYKVIVGDTVKNDRKGPETYQVGAVSCSSPAHHSHLVLAWCSSCTTQEDTVQGARIAPIRMCMHVRMCAYYY